MNSSITSLACRKPRSQADSTVFSSLRAGAAPPGGIYIKRKVLKIEATYFSRN